MSAQEGKSMKFDLKVECMYRAMHHSKLFMQILRWTTRGLQTTLNAENQLGMMRALVLDLNSGGFFVTMF